MKILNILIACECSGTVCGAFRARGHNAYSCDLKPADPSHPHPERHMIGDALEIVKRGCWDPQRRAYVPWDLVIAHPPCTRLSLSGALRLYRDGKKVNGRDPIMWADMIAGAQFFRAFFDACACPLAAENPTMHAHATEIINLPHIHRQTIQPHHFGDNASKATVLWLRGLPPLTRSHTIEPDLFCAAGPQPRIVNGLHRYENQTDGGQNKLAPSPTRAAERAVTYQGSRARRHLPGQPSAPSPTRALLTRWPTNGAPTFPNEKAPIPEIHPPRKFAPRF